MPANENIGYIILEGEGTMNPDAKVVEHKSNHVVAEGIVQTANQKNRNGRYYPDTELFPQLTCPRTVELLEAGYMRAELGHPLSKDLVRQQTIDDSRTCARFLKFWTEGNDVHALFQGTNNEYGKVFEQDLLEGCKPAWSLRALGSIENTRNGAEVRNLKIITFDQVIYPSHPTAYTQKIVSESTTLDPDEFDLKGESYLIPITNESVLNYIRNESANLKYMAESFDFMYDSIDVNPKKSRVTLTGKDGSIYVVNLEDYVAKEIRDYCCKVTEY